MYFDIWEDGRVHFRNTGVKGLRFSNVYVNNCMSFSGSPWKEFLSNEVIYFQETQAIQKLYTKWWKEKSGGKCTTESKKKKTSSLEVTNVGGVFVVLIGGNVAAFLIALFEFLWKAWRNAKADKVNKFNKVCTWD